MNIVLTGFMASGKTSVGRAIADCSEYIFADTDEMIVKKSGMDINTIFEKYGEEYFRSLERDAVKDAAKMLSAVISTGGGVVLDKGNIDALRTTGVIFNLDPDFEVITERLGAARESRPLLKYSEIEDIKKRFEQRKPFYDNCDCKIKVTSGKAPASYAAEILKIMEDRSK